MENSMFYKNDVLQMRDKSQWIVDQVMEDATYLIRSLKTGKVKHKDAYELEKSAIVIKFADPIAEPEKPKCKVYYLAEHRNKMIG